MLQRQSRWCALEGSHHVCEIRRSLCGVATRRKGERKHTYQGDGEHTGAFSSLGNGAPPKKLLVEELVSVLHRCRKEQNSTEVLRVYTYIRRNALETHASLGSLLVSALADVGCMCNAQHVFDKLVYADDAAWNSLITGYVRHGNLSRAFAIYQRMQEDDARHPSVYTFVALLKSCSALKHVQRGCKLHAEIAKRGLLGHNLFIGSSLIDFYGKCGFFDKAQEVFDKLSIQDVVSWTALIGAYAARGRGEEALACYEQMHCQGVCLNAVTFICSLKACGHVRSPIKGGEIHGEIVLRGIETDLLVGSTLVDTYAKCGLPLEAQKVFDKLPSHGVVSWTALIAGYAEQGRGEIALGCLKQMQEEGVSPNDVTLMCSLKACGSVGATHIGRESHAEIAKKGYERQILVGSALVDMYAKCGLLVEAQDVFDKLPVWDVVLCNALMAAYVALGEMENVFSVFGRMLKEDMKPDVATLLSVLTGCSHNGLVDVGSMCFKAISSEFGFVPTLDHYTCMVDLLGRAGLLDTAVAMTEKMPLLPGSVAWRSMMGACRKWGNLELGRHVFEHAVLLNVMGPSAYVSMSNLYVDGNDE